METEALFYTKVGMLRHPSGWKHGMNIFEIL